MSKVIEARSTLSISCPCSTGLYAIAVEQPALDAYLVDQHAAIEGVGDQIRVKEVELSAAIASNKVIAQLGNRNNAASRVVGRISLFLENLVSDVEMTRLQAEEKRLKAKADDLGRKIGADDSGERPGDCALIADVSDARWHA